MASSIRGSDNFDSASGFKSVGTLKAWVNFNGTGTVAIKASGNVSSIVDNGVGMYTINFTSAMPDANYATTAGTTGADYGLARRHCMIINKGTTSCWAITGYTNEVGSGPVDYDNNSVVITR